MGAKYDPLLGKLRTSDASGGMSIGGAVTSGTGGSVLYVDGSGNLAQDNPNFFWDATNRALGINIHSPSYALAVAGSVLVGSVAPTYPGRFNITSAVTGSTATGVVMENTASAGIIGVDLFNSHPNTGEFFIGIGGPTATAGLADTATVQTYGATPLKIGTNGTATLYLDTSSRVGIGNTAPGVLLDLGLAGTTLGVLRLAGSTSGNITLQPAVVAGSWSLTLPTTGGTSGYFLQTNGSGVTTWAAAGVSIGGAVGSGTSASILFVDGSGNLTQDNVNLFYGAGGTTTTHFQAGPASFLKGGIDVGDTAYFDTTVAMSIKSGRTWLFNMYGNTTNPLMFLGQNGHLSLKTVSSGTNATLTVNDPNTLDSLACAHISIDATGHKGLIIQGFGTGSIQEWQSSGGVIFAKVNSEGVFFPVQAATVSAPTYVKGGVYFDTTLNKLMVGGATAWETVTST